jgi:hypothetical protein
MDAIRDDFIVTTTDDGRIFQCSVAGVGAKREQRWLLIDANRELHIGPAWLGDVPEPQLRTMVNEWWLARKR